MITDVHAHCVPDPYRQLLDSSGFMRSPGRGVALAGPGPGAVLGDDQASIERRLAMMDEAGVERQVLSPPGLAPYSHDSSAAVAAARMCNDHLHELVQSYPRRFAAFVSLPLPHVDAALEEMARGLDQLGMVGIMMMCSVFDRSAAEAEFEPLYEEMNRRGTVLFYHPCQNGICSPMINDYGFTVSVGASLEDTVIVLHLIKRQVIDRFPDIKIIVPHLGGLLPMQLERLDGQAWTPDLPEAPSVTARRLYYDTVGWGSQAALACAHRAFGANHLLTGSDFPVLLSAEPYDRTFSYINESELPPEDVDAILNRNAAAFLGL
jgi:predicted TIM-barrel fold metal-dependent hydrolase